MSWLMYMPASGTRQVRAMVLGLVLAICLAGCTGVPDGVRVVDGFELDRYLGRWYEIARLDHPFERGLSHVTAEYSIRQDGGVDVLNRGFDMEAGEWQEAVGRAYFVEAPDVGRLKVSFFGPFYGGYNIIALDQEHYAHALVCGPDRSYLWILARSPVLDGATVEALVHRASELGFATDELIFVDHDENRY